MLNSIKMPPKKIKLDPRQQKLSGFFGNENNKEKSTSEVDINCNTLSVTPTEKKERKFVDKWLTLYSWLRYDKDLNYMFCVICTENSKMNGMHKLCKSQNFQHSTLTRHVQLNEHKLCVLAPDERLNLQKANEKHESEQDKAILTLLKSMHWMVKENIALCKLSSFVGLLQDFGVPDIGILKSLPFKYDSDYSSNELLNSLATVADTEVTKQLRDSPCVTLLADESTDICNAKRRVLYAQTISSDMTPSTIYVNNIECHDATGKGIATAILNELATREIPVQNILSFGSDGASVMTGKKNGVAAIIRRHSPHMVNVHCIAHRLALCTSQAAADIPLLHKHQQVLTDLFYYFKGSSKREARLKEVMEILEGPVLTMKEIHSVRWLSYYNALTTVFRSLDALFTYLQESASSGKDPKACGLKKKMATESFISMTYMLMDAMAPVTILSQFFQTENIDIALVKVKLGLCLDDLMKVKDLESPYCKQLKEDLQQGTFRGQHTISLTNLEETCRNIY